MDLSEKETRERIIDPWLIGDANWKEEYIKREVNSVKSDFKIKRYEINQAIKERNEWINQTKDDSVDIPGEMIGGDK